MRLEIVYGGGGSPLLGVLDTKSVWASHTSFLNDSSECSHAFDIAKEIAESILNNDDFLDTFAWELCRRLRLLRAPDFYITSFSEKPDLLSQWRGYCPGGSGVCIGVDQDLLKAFCEEHGYRFEQCIYDRGALSQKITALIAQCWERFPSPPLDRVEFAALSTGMAVTFAHDYREFINFGDGRSDADSAIEWFCSELIQLAPLYKNEGFHEEAEWRVVVKSPGDIKFRAGVSCLIPYTQLKIFDSNVMLRQLIIGPNPNQERCYQSSKMALESFGFNSALVWRSSIPFNNW